MSDDNKKQEFKGRRALGGIFIPAGLFIGMGIGWAVDDFLPAMFIGLGGGFFFFALTMIFGKD